MIWELHSNENKYERNLFGLKLGNRLSGTSVTVAYHERDFCHLDMVDNAWKPLKAKYRLNNCFRGTDACRNDVCSDCRKNEYTTLYVTFRNLTCWSSILYLKVSDPKGST